MEKKEAEMQEQNPAGGMSKSFFGSTLKKIEEFSQKREISKQAESLSQRLAIEKERLIDIENKSTEKAEWDIIEELKENLDDAKNKTDMKVTRI